MHFPRPATPRRRRVALVLAGLVASSVTASAQATVPWETRDNWRTDAAWYDGQAEKCTYRASRPIYGVARAYTAFAYTNKQHMDPRSGVKLAGSPGTDSVEVFKHHWSERVPTEAYDYDFSTATFTRTDDLGAFRLTVGTQEDCGTSFKSIWRLRSKAPRFAWLESVYLPGAGIAQGELAGADLHFTDELPLLLRDFPFESEPDASVAFPLELVPSQKDNDRVSFEPVSANVTYRGRSTLALPIGTLEAYELRVTGSRPEDGHASYWFAAEGNAPYLHALVRYAGADGSTLELVAHERTAYWER